MKKNPGNIWALVMAGSIFFITAFNNSDYTKNPSADSANASANADTTMSNPTGTDTSSAAVSPKSAEGKTSSTHKNGRVSLGKMTERKSATMKPDKDGVYEMTDVRPAFPGGQAALEDYVNTHIEYQQPAIDNNTEGTVDVQFVIDENGSVSNAKVI